MTGKEIPDSAIGVIASHINARSNKNYGIPTIGTSDNPETPQVFEILPFDRIDETNARFYAIDGSYNSEQFYNGLSIGMYTAGFVCFHRGKQVRMNSGDDPVILGRAYYPENLLASNEEHLGAIYDELLTLPPVKRLFKFWSESPPGEVLAYEKDKICVNLSTLLSFCQEILELALVLEVAELPETSAGDFILRDGTLRPLLVRQSYLVDLGRHLHDKGIRIVAITKQSPIKMELSYTFKQIDSYLQDELKQKYPFRESNPRRRKLCCWFEVPSPVLKASYQGDMFVRKAITGGRGFGLFMAARLDYVEKLQNYDWVISDVNIFDAIPGIASGELTRDQGTLSEIFLELTRLTQEHYILGYPYPLAEAHSFVSLRKDFKDQIIRRLKYSLYRDQRMDHVDIENLFLDMHERF